MSRLGILMSAMLLGSAAAQGTPGTAPRDNPFTALVRSARQVIVYTPTLNDPRLVNALKVGWNLNVPVRVLTTDDGLMQENGLILRLIVLDLPVFRVASGGDRRSFLEVETAQGWVVYDLRSGEPRRARMYDFNAFNAWYGANARRLPRFIPERAVGLWVKAHLGQDLKYSAVRMDLPSAANSAASFLDTLTTPPAAR